VADQDVWTVSTYNLVHNHPPLENFGATLSHEEMVFIEDIFLGNPNAQTKDVISTYRKAH
jgi:hypothetical protein